MKRQHVGTEEFAIRRPQTGFTLDRDTVSAQLPTDAPPSLVLLALQCCEYEAGNRPFSDDVQGASIYFSSFENLLDWLADLHTSMPDDTIPLPPMNPILAFAEDAPPTLPPATQMNSRPTSVSNCSPQEEVIGDGIRDLYSSGDGKTILKAGYIWKKNNTGFRNWKFRWMVLTPFQLKSES
jgi:hypothetical protein